jgi:coproporphyrinogen III oxidase-like Fe-S oxidoreductase
VGCLGEGAGQARRWRNEPDPRRYLQAARERGGSLEVEEEHLDAQALVREALMLGLRTREGVDLGAVAQRAGVDPREHRADAIARRVEHGDLVHEGERLRVPQARWLHLDAIVADLF